jgi:alpha-amylase/alpha-mannosidase (GH57 family)
MARFLCIHGHFYQPPRENPWLETVETQDSAYPYHDWNARITAECYAPNAAARILDGDGRIASIVNNYERMSFDFGPTLLAWLEAQEPRVYAAVLAADRASRERFSGHGSAMAQAYNHVILPLANPRDKQTQIVWGLRDFAHRFGRAAAGLWLPETAVDLASLDLLAAHGVRFTVLAPHQARRVRALAGEAWRDVSGGGIDTTRPYEVRLPSGRRLAVFFYDGPIARAVAFEDLLTSGERFAGRLLAGVPHDGAGDGLVHVATDGETYGHHHRFGDMALAYALLQVEANGWAELINYAAYLAGHPPAEEVELIENTSWSCAHGIDRWRDDCGCRLGGNPRWNQAWRAPLRLALDELRDELAPLYEQESGELFASPWEARDDYIAVVLDRSAASVDAFLERHAAGPTPAGERRVRALKLLEMQRHALLMYTSCGWFFDDLAGVEAVQVLRYAGRAAQLAGELTGDTACERALLRGLAWAHSNDPKAGSGRDLYEAQVRPAAVAAPQVAAHYAVRSLFVEYPNPAQVYGHQIERRDGFHRRAGRARLAVGRLRVTTLATGAAEELCYGAVYYGDPHLVAGVRPLAGEPADAAAGTRPPAAAALTEAAGVHPLAVEAGSGAGGVRQLAAEASRAAGEVRQPAAVEAAPAGLGSAAAAVDDYEHIAAQLDEAFTHGNLPQVVRLIDQGFAHPAAYSLQSLFSDEQRDILDRILEHTLAEVEDQLRNIFHQHAPLMRYLSRGGTPLPAAFRATADFVVRAGLRPALADPEADPHDLERRLDEAAQLGLSLDDAGLGLALEEGLTRVIERLGREPRDTDLLARAVARAALARSAPFPVDLWRPQNLCHELRETVYPACREAAAAGDRVAAAWAALFRQLAEALSLQVT